jgi:hypothetical protein
MTDYSKLSDAMMGNYNAANQAMNLTPQEQALYQLHLSNLWGNGGVNNPDGSRSTLYQMTASPDGSNYYTVPTVSNGQILPPDVAWQQAQQQGLSQYPSYPSPEAADARYMQMHGYMDQDTGAYFGVRNGPTAAQQFDPSDPLNSALFAAMTK